VLTLSDTVLTDAHNRTGYIASNYQFQFDNPPQAGAIYTAGFSACTNGSLALGGSAVFWQCASGTFYNLYDRYWAEQCEPALIVALPCGGDSEVGGPQSGGASETVVGTQVVTTTMVVPLSDGQPQIVTTTSVVYICQIGDGGFPFPVFAFLPAFHPEPAEEMLTFPFWQVKFKLMRRPAPASRPASPPRRSRTARFK
jgi:hypothetical protein